MAKNKSLEKYFDKHSLLWWDMYDRRKFALYLFNLCFRRGLFDRWKLTFESSQPITGKTVLDVGCGSGIYCLEFARQGAKKAVGLDIAKGMIELAQQKAQALKMDDRCQFIHIDFMGWESPETFDVVLAMGVFDYLSEPLPFLKKMVEKSKGLVLASFPGRSFLREPIRKLRYRWKGFPVYFYSKEDIAELAQKAGIRNFEVIPFSSSAYFLKGKLND